MGRDWEAGQRAASGGRGTGGAGEAEAGFTQERCSRPTQLEVGALSVRLHLYSGLRQSQQLLFGVRIAARGAPGFLTLPLPAHVSLRAARRPHPGEQPIHRDFPVGFHSEGGLACPGGFRGWAGGGRPGGTAGAAAAAGTARGPGPLREQTQAVRASERLKQRLRAAGTGTQDGTQGVFLCSRLTQAPSFCPIRILSPAFFP